MAKRRDDLDFSIVNFPFICSNMYLSVDKIFQSLWFLSGDRGLLLTFGKYYSSNICSIFSFLCSVVSTIVYLFVKLLDRPHLEERCLHLFFLDKIRPQNNSLIHRAPNSITVVSFIFILYRFSWIGGKYYVYLWF